MVFTNTRIVAATYFDQGHQERIQAGAVGGVYRRKPIVLQEQQQRGQPLWRVRELGLDHDILEHTVRAQHKHYRKDHLNVSRGGAICILYSYRIRCAVWESV